MALTRDEVLHVATLARLSLLPDEIELFTRQLNDILAYMEKLQELDTEKIEPLAHVIPVFNVFREDKVTEGTGSRAGQCPGPGRWGLFGAQGYLRQVLGSGFWVLGSGIKIKLRCYRAVLV